jgi:hypothetical protein
MHGIGPRAFILLATPFGSSSWVSISRAFPFSNAFFHAWSQVFDDKQQQLAGWGPNTSVKKKLGQRHLQPAGPIATDLAFILKGCPPTKFHI